MPDEVLAKNWKDYIGPAVKWGGWVLAMATWLAATVTYMASPDLPAPPPPPPFPAQVDPALDVPPVIGQTDAGEEFIPATGWVQDPGAVEKVIEDEQIPNFKDTPAGKAVLDGEDAFLWRVVPKVNGRYPNVNQQSVGCCVGCGFKHSVDVLQGVQIANGSRFSFKPVSVEAIYGASRVEIGRGGIRGDGSVGAWAYKAVKEIGNLPMESDLAVFNPERARAWGRSGVPDSLEPKAREHLVKGGAKVTSAAEAAKAIRQGYPVPVCSNQGFRMQRDSAGFCRPSGSWAHCMAFIGVRGGDKPGLFCLNSWGDSAHTGPRWPEDAPAAGFWVDLSTADRMLRQGDSFALSDVAGFPARKLDWNIRHVPSVRLLPAPAADRAHLALAW